MAGLSEEEFHRYQQVLLELKSSKYQLEDEKRQLLAKVHVLENSLSKKDEIIGRSKKTREFEILSNENDTMRHKIFAQGEEFRLQSETLMKEYSQIVKENEKLVQQLEAYREGCAEEESSFNEVPDSSKEDKHNEKIDYYRHEIRELCKAKQGLEEETEALKRELNQLKDSHESMTVELTKLKIVKSDLETQNSNFKQSILSKEAIHTKDLENVISKHQKTVEELEESMVIRMQQLREENDDTVARLKASHSSELKKLGEEMNSKMDDLKSSHDSEKVLQQNEIEILKTSHEKDMNEVKEKHDEDLSELRQKHSKELEDKDNAIAAKEKEHEFNCAARDAEVASLKQQIDDLKNSFKIQEKKNLSGMRDLKKQLIAEARRADELQRRLEEIMVDATSRQSLEELFRPPMSNRLIDDGGGSLRSWNASNSGIGTESSTAVPATTGAASNGGSGATSAAAMFGFTGEDVRLMIQRLTDTQQENCILKEKVLHLEENNSCYAEDLRQKTAIIERYVSSSHVTAVTQSPAKQTTVAGDPTTGPASAVHNGVARDLERLSSAVKTRLGELMKSDAEVTNKNVQKNLQRLLEETLTKNIHLEENLLLLSTELETAKSSLRELRTTS